MALSRDEQIRRIKIMQSQGASPAVIQRYLDSQQSSLSNVPMSGAQQNQDKERKPSLGTFIGRSARGLDREEDKPGGIGGFLGDVFDTTIGAVARTFGAPMRARETQAKAKVQENVQTSRRQFTNSADQYIEMANKTKDPARKRELLDLARNALQTQEGLAGEAADINRGTPQSRSTGGDIKRIAGDALGAALTLAPGAKGTGFGMRGPISTAPVPRPSSLGQAVRAGARSGGKYGAGFGAAGSLSKEESLGSVALKTGTGAATGAAFGGLIGGASYGARQGIDKLRDRATERAAEKARESAGKIVQSKKASDIPKAQRAFTATGRDGKPLVDVDEVKTYKDLQKALKHGIKKGSNQVDDVLGQSKKPIKLNQLGTTTTEQIGGRTVRAKQNPIKDALDDLLELYTKQRDPSGAARIRAIAQKGRREGLTPLEINKIAREYGSEFGKKAFSKVTGEPLTSVSAGTYENTRSAVKGVVRGLLPDENLKAMDRQISDMIRTETLARKMAEKVQRLEQRIEKRNIVERIARASGATINALTGGAPKALFSKLLLPSNVGLKTLNSLDIEERLVRNLAVVRALEQVSDSVMLSVMDRVANQIAQQPIPGDAVNQVILDAISGASTNFGGPRPVTE